MADLARANMAFIYNYKRKLFPRVEVLELALHDDIIYYTFGSMVVRDSKGKGEAGGP